MKTIRNVEKRSSITDVVVESDGCSCGSSRFESSFFKEEEVWSWFWLISEPPDVLKGKSTTLSNEGKLVLWYRKRRIPFSDDSGIERSSDVVLGLLKIFD